MKQFENLLLRIPPGSSVNFNHLVSIRKAKMEQEGFSTEHINWELYAQVLQAKFARINFSLAP